MDMERFWRFLGYLVIVCGILISFVVAVQPFHGPGYRMAFGLLLVGIVPYLVYGALSPFLSGASRGVVGGFILLIDLVTRFARRLGDSSVETASLYWTAPFVMTAVVIAMTWFMGKPPQDREHPGRTRSGGQE